MLETALYRRRHSVGPTQCSVVEIEFLVTNTIAITDDKKQLETKSAKSVYSAWWKWCAKCANLSNPHDK